jgi:hypothetical protein
MARSRIVASGLVTRHRQIPVIQQLLAVTNRAARRSTSTLPWTVRVSEALLEQYPGHLPISRYD